MLTGLARRPILLVLLLSACVGGGVGASLALGGEPGSAPVGAAVTASATGPLPGEEIVSARTRSSRTFAAEHGALRTRFYGDDVNFEQAGGGWRGIDNRLVASGTPGYAYRNAANSWRVDLPARLEERPVRVSEGEHWVSFALEGAAAGGAASGNEATYRDAFPGVDVGYAVTGSSVKETLTLASPEARSRYSFAVDASERLSARMAAGGIEFVDGQGRARFSFAAPFMVDAAGKVSRAVRFELSPSEAGWELGLVADREWIEAPGRRFPVVIDPTTMAHSELQVKGYGTDLECYLRSGWAADTSYCSDSNLRAGSYGGNNWRALMKWGYIHNQIKRDSLILDAKLGIYVNWVDGGNNATFDVHRLTHGFTTAATWNKHDGTNAWTSPGGEFDSKVYASTDIANATGWYYWRVTDLVQDWASGTHENLGLLLKQRGEATSNLLTFTDSDGTGSMPQLDITYTARGGSQPQYTFHSEQLTDRSDYGVNVANGNLMVSGNDVSVPGSGPALNVTRSYNSVPGGWQGFGAWEMNTGADVELQELENGDIVFWGPNAQVAVFRKNSVGGYDQPTGLDARLEKDKPSAGQWRITYLKPQSKLIFNSSKKLTKQVDRNGNDISFSYDSAGYLSKITDTQDRDTTFTVGGTDRQMVTSITDPAGRVHSYSYPNGFLETYTDPDGGITSYSYETTGQTDRLKQITDPRGNKTTFTYTTGCLEWQDPCRVTSIRRYKDATNYQETTFSYNAGAGSGITCKKDTNDTLDDSITGHTIVTDARGYTTTYCYDRELRVVFTKDQEGHSRKNKWTANSNVTRYTAGSGAESDTAYDSTNRVESVKAPGATKETTEENRAAQTFSYVGRASDDHFPSSTTDSQGEVHNFSYTADSSNLTKIQEQNSGSAQVELEYNDNNRNGELTGDTADDGTVRWSKDGRGNKTTYSYDAKGNLTTIDPPGSAQGNVTLAYNTQLSRISSITDGKGQRREFSYDPLDRVTQIKFYNSGNVLQRTDSYSYDKNGNRLTRSDASGSYSYVYDALNRMTEESRPGHPRTYMAYDAMSNLASIIAAEEQVLFTYYPDNIVKEVKEPYEGSGYPTTMFEYNSDNSRTKTTFPSGTGVVEQIFYDRAERPEEIKASKGTTVLTHFKHSYLRSGETKERALKQTADDVRLGRSTRYLYDVLSRVKQAQTTGSASFTWSYEYDNASNRTKKTKGTAVTSYRYNAANELCWQIAGTTTADCSTSPTPTGATTYSYDANGDLTGSSDGLSATYNVAKQKIAYTRPGGSSTTFEYAGQGQTERTKKNSTLYLDTVLGVSAEKGSDYRGYLRDNTGALVGIRNPEGTPPVKKRYYYLKDALGSPVALTNDQGTVVRRHVYNDPYGEEVTDSTVVAGAPTNPYRFAGEHLDSETNLYKIGERYYNPTLARWTQKDPMMQAFSPREANAYGYAGADPVNNIDPTGLHCWDVNITIGLGPSVSYCEGGSIDVAASGGGGVSVTRTPENDATTSWQHCFVECWGLGDGRTPQEVEGGGISLTVEVHLFGIDF